MAGDASLRGHFGVAAHQVMGVGPKGPTRTKHACDRGQLVRRHFIILNSSVLRLVGIQIITTPIFRGVWRLCEEAALPFSRYPRRSLFDTRPRGWRWEPPVPPGELARLSIHRGSNSLE